MKERITQFFGSRFGIILTGGTVGLLGAMLQKLGNPANMGICVACFERDIAGALELHRAAAVQYIRPEIIGFVPGSVAAASGVGIRFILESIPLYPNVKRLAEEWCFPGGVFDNSEFYGPHVRFGEEISRESQLMLFDPQTSGGLLFTVSTENAHLCEKEAEDRRIALWRVGDVTDSGMIEVL